MSEARGNEGSPGGMSPPPLPPAFWPNLLFALPNKHAARLLNFEIFSYLHAINKYLHADRFSWNFMPARTHNHLEIQVFHDFD